jgi:hypothetical protein
VALLHEGRLYELVYTGSTPNDPDQAEHDAIYEHIRGSFELVP